MRRTQHQHNSIPTGRRDSKEGSEGGRDSSGGVIWAVINEPRDTHEHVARKHIDRHRPYDMESQNCLAQILDVLSNCTNGFSAGQTHFDAMKGTYLETWIKRARCGECQFQLTHSPRIRAFAILLLSRLCHYAWKDGCRQNSASAATMAPQRQNLQCSRVGDDYIPKQCSSV